MKNIGKRLIAGATLASGAVLALFSIGGKGAIVRAATVDDYYAKVNTSLKGDKFIQNLSTVINNGAQIGSYKSVWEGLKITDEDPNNPNNILCIYSNKSIPKSDKDGSSSASIVWNREHIWAQSHGIKNDGYAPHNDLHHLRASEKGINGSRGNLDFDNVSNHGGATHSDKAGNKWNSTCFEPRDEVKGDVARMMFYMTTMYSGDNGFNLDLVDRIPTSTTNASKKGEFGKLSTLLEWHISDPVDTIELNRNEKIYGIQHNRNPYIDHPEYVNNAFNVDLDVPENPDHGGVTPTPTPTPTPDPKPEPTPDPDTKPDTPVVPHDGDLSVDFTVNTLGNVEYTDNAVIDMGGNKFYMSSYMAAKNQSWGADCIRLGNKNAIDLSKVGASGRGHYMEPQFDMEGIKSISLNIVNSFSGYEAWEVTFKDQKTGAYESVATGTGNDIKAELSEARNGHFVICIKGDKPRCDLGVLNIYKAGPNINDALKTFEEAELATSIRATYAGGKITKAQIRFGMSIENTALNGARYGVVVMPKESLSGASIKEMLKDTDANSFKSNDTYKVYSLNEYAKVSANKHQFAIVGTITKAPKLELCAAGFLVNDGKLYITRTATASFYNTALAYSNTLEAANKDLLQALLAKIN